MAITRLVLLRVSSCDAGGSHVSGGKRLSTRITRNHTNEDEEQICSFDTVCSAGGASLPFTALRDLILQNPCF